ncbi:SDR family NAD(P)-dependent oxidoreductase [Puia sp.]|uniref:SDR family NAD(P)-dependent oxidoreductase n=1 Tax=Puia sp. TaxID=2045100 RepID=UPI002F3E43DF
MNLQNKNAIVYGAGGSLGGAVAKALAAAGANVFLTGHRIDSVRKIAGEIHAAGGKEETAVVDAFDKAAVFSHLESVVKKAGTVDISFNAVGVDVVQNIPLVDISVEDFVEPITQTMRTRFLTATLTAKTMIRQRSGVILSLTATPGGIGYPLTGGFAPACSAMESFSRNLAAELGIYGIRVVNIRSGGSPDSHVFKSNIDSHPEMMAPVINQMEGDTMLKRLPLMADIANTAVFLASDLARMITGVTVDVTGGTTAGLNYRMARI